MGIDGIGNGAARGAGLRTAKGFTLIASLLLLLLLSGMAIGLLMMVNTEGKVGATDLQNNLAFHAAEGGMEKMASDLSAVFQNIATPSPAQICAVGGPNTGGSAANEPSIPGVTWMDYSVIPGSAQSTSCPTSLSASWGTITGSGQNAGLQAQIIPVNLLTTAAMVGGQEVSMSSQAQVALIPVFQFAVFSETDLLFDNGSSVDVAGPVHTNADLYPCSSNGVLTFHDKVSAWGNVVRSELPNGIAMNPGCTTPVYVPTADGDCAWGGGASSTCIDMATPGALSSGSTPSPYGDGSVTGAGSATAQNGSTYVPNTSSNTWGTFSKTTTNLELINGNYGSTTSPGTGAKKLSLGFVGGGGQPYEIIRRPPAGEDAGSSVGQSREYNMAQIRVLLSDDPTEFQNGSGWSDPENVRLANLTSTQATLQGGHATQTNPFGITIASGNYGSTFGSPSGTNTYNLYFAAASNAIPVPSACSSSSKTCPTADWPYAPMQWTANPSPSVQGLQPAGIAPVFLNNDGSVSSTTPASVPTINLCPPSGVASIPQGCPSGAYQGEYPYYSLPNPNLPVVSSTLTAYNSGNANAWSLIDGYLRVEYKDSSGNWHPVTNEWLSLGFARGNTAPTAPGPSGTGSNPINPNAILLLQQPADRLQAGTAANTTAGLTAYGVPITFPATGATAPSACASYSGNTCATAVAAPTCTTWNSGHTICTAWTAGVPPILAADDGVSGHQWAFGSTPASTSGTTPQSLTQYNWYPINFYDGREGEAREQSWTNGTTAPSSDTTCTTNGVMNAVEIDVGNLKRWLAGNISGTSGGSVDYAAQNGYVLYFSDRRGMLINPNQTSVQTINTKTGDSGLEDVVNSSTQSGAPDGVLDPIPSNRTYSPEDFNQNGVLDNFGTNNLGLGFWGTGNSATQNLNSLINSGTHDDPYGTGGTGSPGYTSNRIASCGTTGRKNWVSGARHVLKLVDGSYGNVPLRPTALVVSGTSYWGGFTVASENPVYVQGDYNSSATEEATWVNPPSTPTDLSLHSAASVIADSVTLLSDYWDDRRSTMGKNDNSSPTTIWNRLASANSYYRMGIVSGKSTNFASPSWVTSGIGDVGVDGGVGNFMRLLENWGYNPSGSGNDTLNYYGSVVNLYYQNYNTGIFKCGGNCWEIYYFGTRHFIFDSDFTNPYQLPPGTPLFHDVEMLNYRQILTPRTQ